MELVLILCPTFLILIVNYNYTKMNNKSEIDAKKNEILSFEKSISYFKNEGISIAKGISEQDIIDLENKINFNFPDDYKRFHFISNGFLDWEMDNNCFSIWTFDRIEELYFKWGQEEPNFIPISDYCINSWWYGYIKGRNGIFSDSEGTLSNSKTMKFVAKDFNEFINLVIADANILY